MGEIEVGNLEFGYRLEILETAEVGVVKAVGMHSRCYQRAIYGEYVPVRMRDARRPLGVSSRTVLKDSRVAIRPGIESQHSIGNICDFIIMILYRLSKAQVVTVWH